MDILANNEGPALQRTLESADEQLCNLQWSIEKGNLAPWIEFESAELARALLVRLPSLAASCDAVELLQYRVFVRFRAYLQMLGCLAREIGSTALPVLIDLYVVYGFSDWIPVGKDEAALQADLRRVRQCRQTLAVELAFRDERDAPPRFPEKPAVSIYDESRNPELYVEAATQWSHDMARRQYLLNYPAVESDDEKGPYRALAAQLTQFAALLASDDHPKLLTNFPFRDLKELLRAPNGYAYCRYELPTDYDESSDDYPSLSDCEKDDVYDELWSAEDRRAMSDALQKFLRRGLEASSAHAPAVQEAWSKAYDIFHENARKMQDDPFSPAIRKKNRAEFMAALEQAVTLFNSEQRVIRPKRRKHVGGKPGRKPSPICEKQVEAAIAWLKKCFEEKKSKTYIQAVRHVLVDQTWPEGGYAVQRSKTGLVSCAAFAMAIQRKVESTPELACLRPKRMK